MNYRVKISSATCTADHTRDNAVRFLCLWNTSGVTSPYLHVPHNSIILGGYSRLRSLNKYPLYNVSKLHCQCYSDGALELQVLLPTFDIHVTSQCRWQKRCGLYRSLTKFSNTLCSSVFKAQIINVIKYFEVLNIYNISNPSIIRMDAERAKYISCRNEKSSNYHFLEIRDWELLPLLYPCEPMFTWITQYPV